MSNGSSKNSDSVLSATANACLDEDATISTFYQEEELNGRDVLGQSPKQSSLTSTFTDLNTSDYGMFILSFYYS